MNKFVIFGLFLATAMAVPMPEINGGSVDCLDLEDGLFSCLFVKANSALARAARSSDLQIIQGVTFIRDTPSKYSANYNYYFFFKLIYQHINYS